MNDIKKQAIKQTAKTLSALTLGSLIAQAAIYFIPLNILLTIFLIGLLGFAAHMIYQSELSKAEYKATLQNIVNK